MADLTVELPQKEINYALKIEKGILDQVSEELSMIHKGKRIVVFTDENVMRHHGEQLKNNLESNGIIVKMIVLESGEQTKQIERVQSLYSQLIEFNVTRSDLIIAFGGGVIGDLAGYIAATFLRGIKLVQIPTTLLAQVDSSVGGKVAVDLPEGKNLVGAFYHPDLVLIDPLVLDTLEDEVFSAGMAEVIKYGGIKDKSFFDFLKRSSSRAGIMENIEMIIHRCCEIKTEVVQSDEKDTSARMVLNFGHTLGHAIEAYYNYKKYTHGQAISIGMVAINDIAEEKSLTEKHSTEELKQIFSQFDLPIRLDQPNDYKDILPIIKLDKKNMDGKLNLILLEEIGDSYIYKADLSFFDSLVK